MAKINPIPTHKVATEYRLGLWSRGFTPLPCRGKRGFMRGWPTAVLDEEIIRGWPVFSGQEREPSISTAVRLDGDLAVIDVDVPTGEASKRIYDGIRKLVGEGMSFTRWTAVPGGKMGHKFAIFFRTDETFARIATDKWISPDGNCQVEAFGSAMAKQMSVHGPHTQVREGPGWSWTKKYVWDRGNLLAVERDDLPLIPFELVQEIVRKSGKMLASQGWKKDEPKVAVRRSSPPPRSGGRYTSKGVAEFAIPTDAFFEVETRRDAVSYADLTRMAGSIRGLRVSGSWLLAGANRSRMAVHPARGPDFLDNEPGVRLYDFETGNTYLPATWRSKK